MSICGNIARPRNPLTFEEVTQEVKHGNLYLILRVLVEYYNKDYDIDNKTEEELLEILKDIIKKHDELLDLIQSMIIAYPLSLAEIDTNYDEIDKQIWLSRQTANKRGYNKYSLPCKWDMKEIDDKRYFFPDCLPNNIFGNIDIFKQELQEKFTKEDIAELEREVYKSESEKTEDLLYSMDEMICYIIDWKLNISLLMLVVKKRKDLEGKIENFHSAILARKNELTDNKHLERQ